MEERICCLCGKKFIGWGNNPWPVDKHPDHKCCDECNGTIVLPARLFSMSSARRDEDEK